MGHHGIHNEVVNGYFRKILANLMADIDEHPVGNFQHIGLVNNADVFFSALGQFEGSSRNAFAALAGNSS